MATSSLYSSSISSNSSTDNKGSSILQSKTKLIEAGVGKSCLFI
jgi:hypothetical protein